MTVKGILQVVGTVVVVAALGYLLSPSTTERKGADAARSEKKHLLRRGGRQDNRTAREAVKAAMTQLKEAPKISSRKRPDAKHFDADKAFAHLSDEDRQTSEALLQAMDDLSFDAALNASHTALVSTNAEVRQSALEAMAWFGPVALPELTLGMADADEDVVESACYHWEQALSEIEDTEDRLTILSAAMATLSNGDALTSMSGQFTAAALEYIDGEDDEKVQFTRRTTIVQTLLDMIEGGNPAASKQALEAYEDITGFAWVDADEAELYLLHPDDYDLPENRDPDAFAADVTVGSESTDAEGTDTEEVTSDDGEAEVETVGESAEDGAEVGEGAGPEETVGDAPEGADGDEGDRQADDAESESTDQSSEEEEEE